MQVLLLNGSPHAQGCTYTALSEVGGQLRREGIDTKLVQLGKGAVRGLACGACEKSGRCVFDDDGVNAAAELMRQSDALIVGSPVYYASPNGALLCFLDRLFYSAGRDAFAHKPAAMVVSARRAGTTASLEVLSKYFTIAQMPVVSSQYWNMVHGFTPDDVRQDAEGLQVMRCLGSNMAWLLKCIDAGRKAGIVPQFAEERVWTNFIR